MYVIWYAKWSSSVKVICWTQAPPATLPLGYLYYKNAFRDISNVVCVRFKLCWKRESTYIKAMCNSWICISVGAHKCVNQSNCLFILNRYWNLLTPLKAKSSLTVSEYDQEIPHSHTAYQPTAPWGRATEHRQSQDIQKTIKAKQPSLSSLSRWWQN